MAQFTTANARLFAARAVEKRQKLALYRQNPPDLSPVQPDQEARQTASDTLELIRNITATLRNEPEIAPDRLDLLTRSLERLWKIYAHAAQVPQPAHRKESRQSRSGQPIDLEPVSFAVLEPAPSVA